MSIDNIHSFICTYYRNSKLSDETIRKLRALGIDPSTVVSEAQAIKLINAAQKTQPVKESQDPKNNVTGSSEKATLLDKDNTESVFTMLDMNASLNKYILGL